MLIEALVVIPELSHDNRGPMDDQVHLVCGVSWCCQKHDRMDAGFGYHEIAQVRPLELQLAS